MRLHDFMVKENLTHELGIFKVWVKVYNILRHICLYWSNVLLIKYEYNILK